MHLLRINLSIIIFWNLSSLWIHGQCLLHKRIKGQRKSRFCSLNRTRCVNDVQLYLLVWYVSGFAQIPLLFLSKTAHTSSLRVQRQALRSAETLRTKSFDSYASTSLLTIALSWPLQECISEGRSSADWERHTWAQTGKLRFLQPLILMQKHWACLHARS